MKKCSYCGKEYPDDAEMCVIDQTPFESHVESVSSQVVIPKNKIPLSLAIISYVFFFPAALYFVGLLGLVFCMFFVDNPLTRTDIKSLLIATPFAIFFTCLSRGLRRCSSGWRTCALVLTWWGFIQVRFITWSYFEYPDSEFRFISAGWFLLFAGFGFAFQLWQYRILTRPDVQDLFL